MKKFSIEMTNFVKGIAIILMIIHHLFWNFSGYGLEISGVAISQRIAIVGKVCVSIFLLLSGYGMFESLKKNSLSIKGFVLKRLTKLYLNYLLIVIISTLIGVIFFKDSFLELVQPNLKGICKFILTLSGVQYLVGYQGFNPSWWFMTCIMIYYILTPAIKKLIYRFDFKFIMLYLIISCVNFINIGRLNSILNIISWLFPYILGCYLSHNDNLNKIKIWFNTKFKRCILIISFLILLFIRQIGLMNNPFVFKLDFLLAFLIVLLTYIYFEKLILKKEFIYLGKKSSDIYYVHMFVANYYLNKFIYKIEYPILMVCTVLAISIGWSYLIDIFRIIINKKHTVRINNTGV